MFDVIIIGCGITGAAMAYELSKYNLKTAVLEKQNDVATGTTKANSAILHAGYDPKPDTLMARLNVRGSVLAKQLCQSLDVPYKQIGSLVLAFNNDDLLHLQKLYNNGKANGVEVQLLSAQQVLEKEPNISTKVMGALYAPSAAIVSPWEYALALAETAVKNGTQLMLNTQVQSINKTNDGYVILTDNGTFECKFVINAAGTHAGELHRAFAPKAFTDKPSRGEYYLLDKQEGSRVSHIIFQCPNAMGKGVLVAPTVHGNLIVGPNAVDCDTDDLKTTSEGLSYVAQTAKKSVPDVDLRACIRNFSGVRANTNIDDFIIEFAHDGVLSLAGIKSPGLTAAPAISEYAAQLLAQKGLELTPKTAHIQARSRVKFKDLTSAEKAEIVKSNPSYGRVICRCETVTEGEILDSINSPIPPVSLDGVKRRVGAGMGRCQGGFCGPRVLEILSRAQNCDDTQIMQDLQGTYILTGKTKEAEN